MQNGRSILLAALALLMLSACATTPSPVWQDINYRMTSGKVPYMGPSAPIGP
jgi:starvation-inducible outer membrane lipoprotein